MAFSRLWARAWLKNRLTRCSYNAYPCTDLCTAAFHKKISVQAGHTTSGFKSHLMKFEEGWGLIKTNRLYNGGVGFCLLVNYCIASKYGLGIYFFSVPIAHPKAGMRRSTLVLVLKDT